MSDFLQETKAQLIRWLIHTRREPFSMAFNLRPGFRLTRMWDNLPGMYNLSYEY